MAKDTKERMLKNIVTIKNSNRTQHTKIKKGLQDLFEWLGELEEKVNDLAKLVELEIQYPRITVDPGLLDKDGKIGPGSVIQVLQEDNSKSNIEPETEVKIEMEPMPELNSNPTPKPIKKPAKKSKTKATKHVKAKMSPAVAKALKKGSEDEQME